ncbi:hypothetical protein JL107_10685 [Nakamurella flavida]|uniref:Secreted protein n=1 Tax=Nakamurella flavida TaxID=363630 RepID=A0A939C671_9ACTN|nr:hypothetical protein [Nakamurella flavida]MBM9476912.1 hypothetical protein [Nakamurella flavida]MDP9779857.1 dienelactone hydrolase [Nakamurella flavida]
MKTRRRPTLPGALAVLLLVGGLVLAPPLAGAASAAPGDVVDSGPGWTITETADGYRIELTVADPLPVRSAEAGLEVDGVDLTSVSVSADRRRVQAETPDPAVRNTDTVVLTWDGDPAVQAADGTAGDTAPPASGPVLDADPAVAGPYTVARADYDLGDEVEDLAGLEGRRGEIRGAVYYPAEKTTASPVALFLHGRHTGCVSGPEQWPCTGGASIPSYLGYDQPAQALASNGVVVVSVSADAINVLDNFASDGGTQARGQLVLDTLTRLAQADTVGAPGFDPVLRGRLDLTRVGLMGHSRGGAGVVRAARMNSQLDQPFGIRSVFPLAPTNPTRETAPGVATAVLLPYCDGDVSSLDGQHFVDDAQGAFDDSVLRTSLLVMGTNHNYFNTIWSPGGFSVATSDDWSYVDEDQSNPVCGQNAPGRLDQAAQRAVGTAYLSGFFRLTLADDTRFLPLFDGSRSTVASARNADVRVAAQAPADDRIDLAPTASTTLLASGVQAAVCTGSGTAALSAATACSTLAPDQVPHWGPAWSAGSLPTSSAFRMRWDAAGGSLDLPFAVGSRDVSTMTDLTFTLAPDEAVAGSTDVTAEVYDGTGTTRSLDPALLDDALRVLPGTTTPLRRVVLQQVRVPLSSLAGLDLTDIRGIRFRSGTDTGGVYIADVAATRSSVGRPEVRKLPTLSLAPTGVRQVAATRAGSLAVLLDEPSPRPVTTWIVTHAQAGVSTRITATTKVTVPAGQRCAPASFPVPGAGEEGVSVARIDADGGLITAALPGIATAEVTVQPADLGDDGPQVGEQGDVCAEALTPIGTLGVPGGELRPGDAFTVTGSGFRAGETVTLTVPGAADVTALADGDGAVRIAAAVPADASPGAAEVTAVGYGSSLRATGSITVTAAAPPTSSDPSTSDPATSDPSTSDSSTTSDPATSDPVTSDPATSSTTTTPVVTSTVTAVVVPVVRTTSRDAAAVRSGSLAHTGVDVGGLISAGVLLIGAGLTVVVTTRRRTRRAH